MMFSNAMMMAGMSGYNIPFAALFDGSTGYLSRTFGAGDQAMWSYSTWVNKDKANREAVWLPLLSSATASNFEFAFYAGTLRLYVAGAYVLITTAVFDDPSAFMHVLLVLDTNNATVAHRARLYVNGVEVTAFSTDNRSALSGNYEFNAAGANYICRGTPAEFCGGINAQTVFVDGATAVPTDFGKFDMATGRFIPIPPVVPAYGTNGCFLNFSNSGALGTDAAPITVDHPTANNWTVTGGVTQVQSTPTNVYGTLNPLQCKASAVLSNGNKTSTNSSGISGGTAGTLAFDIATSTFEWQWTINSGYYNALGIVQVGDETITTSQPATQHIYYGFNGQTYIGASNTAYGATFTTGDLIKIRVNSGAVNFYKWNGSAWVDQGVAWSGLTGMWLPWGAHGNPGAHTVDFGQDGFVPEPGYTTLCTKNLSAVTGKNIDNHFKTVLYTGTGAVTGDTIAVNGIGFQPDFVWMKSRDAAHHHHIEDSVRGANNGLLTNDSAAQYTSYQMFQSFDADGFTAKYDSAMSITSGNVNGAKTVAWCASLPDATIPTGGTITLTGCRSNATLGMAIITYTGNGVAGATLPHPCGKKPGMFIIKRLDAAGDWPVYHQDVGATKTLCFNSTIAATLSAVFNNTEPTSTLITLGDSSYPDLNAVGGTYVAYVFYETDFCKIGSYTNNNSADGPFINEMISPVWGLFKSNSSSSWYMYDDERPGYNPVANYLLANTSDAEGTSGHDIDFSAVGVKMRTALDPNYSSYGTYYLMFGQPTGGSNIPPTNAR